MRPLGGVYMRPGAVVAYAGAAGTNSVCRAPPSRENPLVDEQNRSIWLAGAFGDKSSQPKQICGRQRFEWRAITALVQRIMVDGKRLVIVVAAAGSDPRNPTQHDLTNAQISALIVSRQSQFRRYRCLNLYLEYRGPTLLEVRVDLRKIAWRLRNRWANCEAEDSHSYKTPSPILAFLLRRYES